MVAVAAQHRIDPGQHRAGREALVTPGAEAHPAAGARRGDGAGEAEIGCEPAAEPVLADRQQVGETADFAGALQPQRQPALRRHRKAEGPGADQERYRARKAYRGAGETGDPPVEIEAPAVPVGAERQPEPRHMPPGGKAEAADLRREMAARGGDGAADRRREAQGAVHVGVPEETGARRQRQIGGGHSQRQRLAAETAVTAQSAAPEGQGEAGEGEVGAVP